MTSLEKPDLVTTNVRYRLPNVHPEGRKFVVIAAAICAVLALLSWETLAWPMAGVTLLVAAFFRDPIRTTPKGEGLIIAPADGMVTMIADVPAPLELVGEDGLLEGNVTRLSIFMSVFDVQINRAPIAGEIKRVVYSSGKYLNAGHGKASEENERQHILIEGHNGLRVGFTQIAAQIAGLVANRVVPWVKPGDFVAIGQRVGLIRFGSRVDIYLPTGTSPQVILGQRTIAGETIVGRAGVAETIEGISQ